MKMSGAEEGLRRWEKLMVFEKIKQQQNCKPKLSYRRGKRKLSITGGGERVGIKYNISGNMKSGK